MARTKQAPRRTTGLAPLGAAEDALQAFRKSSALRRVCVGGVKRPFWCKERPDLLFRHRVEKAAEAARVLLVKVKAQEVKATKKLLAALVAADKIGRERRRLEREACVDCNILGKLSPEDAPEDIEAHECAGGCGEVFCEECHGDLNSCYKCGLRRFCSNCVCDCERLGRLF